jgi:hypothetical protein
MTIHVVKYVVASKLGLKVKDFSLMFGYVELSPDTIVGTVIRSPENYLLVKMTGEGGVKKTIQKKGGGSKLIVKPITIVSDPPIIQSICGLQALPMEQFINSLGIEDLQALNQSIITNSRTGNLDVLAARYIKHLPEHRTLKVRASSVIFLFGVLPQLSELKKEEFCIKLLPGSFDYVSLRTVQGVFTELPPKSEKFRVGVSL